MEGTMATAEAEVRAIDETLGWIHDQVGLTYDQIGSILDVSERTLRRWRHMDNSPRPRQKERIESLRELQHLLGEVFPESEAREQWLHSPSRLLRGRSPISLLRGGQVSRVVGALATLESGAFT
jgi:putative toxin-antitoxin system antitoxin component (TIGR02293 family)